MAKEQNILMISDYADMQQIKDAAMGVKDVQVRALTTSFSSGWNSIVEHKPNVVVLVADTQYDEYMQLIKKIKAYYHGITLFLVSNNEESEYILAAFKAGVKDFIKLDTVVEELQLAIQGLVEETDSKEKHGAMQSKVISVFSNKGGIGVTSVAVNLAAAFAEINGARTLVCDFVFQHGDIAIFLDTPSKSTITDIISNMNRIDKIFLENTLSKTGEGLYVVHGPDKPEEGDYINATQLSEVLQIFRSYFDYIIIDMNHNYSDNNITIFDNADMILLLLTLELPSICNCGKTLEVFQKLRYERDKVKLVVNRTNARNQIDVQIVEEQLNYPTYMQLPNDYMTVVKGINNGQSVFEVSKGSAVASAMRVLRDKILGDFDKEFPEEKKGLFDKLFKKS